MGIKGLVSLVKKYNPSIVQTENLDYFRGKKIALDISIYINKYVSSSRENWISLMCYLLMNLRYNDIDVIIIFDGKYVPPEKQLERESRKTNRQSQATRCDKLQSLFDRISTMQVVDLYTQHEVQEIFKRSKVDFSEINCEDPEELQILLREKIEKATIASQGVQPYHKEITRRLVKGMGFSYIEAYGEAEALCASLAFHGIVDAVVSTDSDCFAYGAPILITEIKGGKWTFMRLKDVLKALDMKFEPFVDLCISLGCDYNKNMTQCGPARVMEKLKMYGSLDVWKEQEPQRNFEVLRYEKCRKYFTPYTKEYLEICNFKVPGDVDPKFLTDVLVGTIYTCDYVSQVQRKEKRPSLYFQRPSLLDD